MAGKESTYLRGDLRAAQVRHTRKVSTLLTLFVPLAIWSKATSSASISTEIDVGPEHNRCNPIVRVTFKNLSASPIQIGAAGAFFDYQFQLTDAKGRRVSMTKEGLDIRNGNGAIVMSAMILTLNPNETQQEDLDLARYFNLSTGAQPYRLVLVRVLDRSGERITSNSLIIATK